MPSSDLKITGLAKRYGTVVALAPTDLEVAKGEFLTLLGPVGLRQDHAAVLIAGLTHPDAGEVFINGSDVTYGAPYAARHRHGLPELRAVPAHDGRREHRASRSACGASAARSAERRVARGARPRAPGRTGARLPRELSGGQQQRIALARCLVYAPRSC